MDLLRRKLLAAPLIALGTRPAARARPPEAARPGAWAPKISENLADVEPATLRWLAQLGCKYVIFQGTDHVDADGKGM